MKFLKYFFSLVVSLVIFSGAIAADKSDASVHGHVVNGKGEHMPYITVIIKGTTVGTITDVSGHYNLQNLPVGEFTLVASSMGYKTVEVPIVTQSKESKEINFTLKQQAVKMDEIVVSSNRNETNRLKSASIVNVASKKLFESTASTNLSESMSFQPGLRVENTCGNCGATQLRINGLEGQYSQILLDSRPIFSSLSQVYGLEQIPVSMIERVEVVRGGGSALYGSSAIAGVVNIITKEPMRNSVQLSNTTNVLKGGTTDVNTSFNGSFVSDDNKAGVYLFGMVKDREAYDRNQDGFSDLTEVEAETIGFRGYYKTSNYSKITAEYHHIREYRRGGDQLDNPPHESMIAEMLRHNINGGGLSFDYFSPNYKHKFSLYSSLQSIARESYFGAEMDANAYGNTSDLTAVAGGQYNFSYNGGFMPADLTAGIEYNYNSLHDVMVGYDRDLKQTTNIVGAFFQNEWKNDKFNILLGGRLDKHNLMDNVVFSPRANVRYAPSSAIAFRASYSSGYRAPQAYNEDLHIEAVAGDISIIELDPNLKPEYSNSLSGSVDLYRSIGKLQFNLLLEGFYTKLDDLFTLVNTGEHSSEGVIIYQRTNASGATVKGITTEFKMGIPSKFELQAGYTFQKSHYAEAEQWSDDIAAQTTMYRSPDHYAYMNAIVNVTPKLDATLFGNYTGKMLVQHSTVDGDSDVTTPDFFDMGVQLSYDIKASDLFTIELSGGVKNIFDSYQKDLDYGATKDAGYVYGPSLPRTGFFGVKLNF